MLRLRAETYAQVLPCLHYSRDAKRAYPLYRLGENLSVRVGLLTVWPPRQLTGSKLFGEDDEENDSAELDKAQASGENGKLDEGFYGLRLTSSGRDRRAQAGSQGVQGGEEKLG